MKTTFNQETGVKTWLMDKWYQKSAFVFGVVMFWFYIICVIIGIAGEIN